MPKLGEKIVYLPIAGNPPWDAVVLADRGGDVVDLDVVSLIGTPVLTLTGVRRGSEPGTWAPAVSRETVVEEA